MFNKPIKRPQKRENQPIPVTPDEVERHLAPSYEEVVKEVNQRLMSGCSTFNVYKLTLYIDRLVEDFTKAGWHVKVIHDAYPFEDSPSELQFSRYQIPDE